MHNEQLPALPAVNHVPAEMVTDASRAAFRLATTQANCASEQAKREAARLLNRAANIQAALAAGRWAWLEAAGVISQATFVELLAAELEADGFGA